MEPTENSKNRKIWIIGLVSFSILIIIAGVIIVINNKAKEVPEGIATSLQEASCSDEQLAELISIVDRNRSAAASEQKAQSSKALADCYVLRKQYTEAAKIMGETAKNYEQAGLSNEQQSASQTAATLEQASTTPANPPETPEGIPDVDPDGAFAN